MKLIVLYTLLLTLMVSKNLDVMKNKAQFASIGEKELLTLRIKPEIYFHASGFQSCFAKFLWYAGY